MSTRSCIAMKQNDGTYKSIYCHNNGGLEHNGVLLYHHYSDPIKVQQLLDLGDISLLEENVIPDATKEHSFDNRQDYVTVAYHRDRNEELRFDTYDNKKDLLKEFEDSYNDYLYLFENEKWYFNDHGNKYELRSLEKELLREKYIDSVASPPSYSDELAIDLLNYLKDFDPYEFNDVYDNDEMAFDDIKDSLSTSDKIYDVINSLSNDIQYYSTEKDLRDKEIFDLSKRAFNLINKLNQYSKTLEKFEDKELKIE